MWTTVAKMLKGKESQRIVQAIVINEARFVLQWYLFIILKAVFNVNCCRWPLGKGGNIHILKKLTAFS